MAVVAVVVEMERYFVNGTPRDEEGGGQARLSGVLPPSISTFVSLKRYRWGRRLGGICDTLLRPRCVTGKMGGGAGARWYM